MLAARRVDWATAHENMERALSEATKRMLQEFVQKSERVKELERLLKQKDQEVEIFLDQAFRAEEQVMVLSRRLRELEVPTAAAEREKEEEIRPAADVKREETKPRPSPREAARKAAQDIENLRRTFKPSCKVSAGLCSKCNDVVPFTSDQEGGAAHKSSALKPKELLCRFCESGESNQHASFSPKPPLAPNPSLTGFGLRSLGAAYKQHHDAAWV